MSNLFGNLYSDTEVLIKHLRTLAQKFKVMTRAWRLHWFLADMEIEQNKWPGRHSYNIATGQERSQKTGVTKLCDKINPIPRSTPIPAAYMDIVAALKKLFTVPLCYGRWWTKKSSQKSITARWLDRGLHQAGPRVSSSFSKASVFLIDWWRCVFHSPIPTCAVQPPHSFLCLGCSWADYFVWLSAR